MSLAAKRTAVTTLFRTVRIMWPVQKGYEDHEMENLLLRVSRLITGACHRCIKAYDQLLDAAELLAAWRQEFLETSESLLGKGA